MAVEFEKIEKKANSEGWYFRKFRAEPCTGCFKSIVTGFVLSPGMNYPICAACAEKEFA